MRKFVWLSWISLGTLADFPENQTRLATYRNPLHQALGRPDREHSVLGAPRSAAKPLPGLRDQLHASWMPGALVPGVRALYVSVPRRGLLLRRPPRVGSAAARRFTGTSHKVDNGQLWIQAGEMPTLGEPLA